MFIQTKYEGLQIMNKKEVLKKLEEAHDDVFAYSQHPAFKQEEFEARQRIITLQEYIKQIK